MKNMLLVALVVTSTMAFCQDHAPSHEQCKADGHLWDVDVHDSSVMNKLPYGTLMDRSLEMMLCLNAYPASNPREMGDFIVWKHITQESLAEMNNRLFHFIQRRDLLTDFQAEDAAGKR